MNPLFNSPVRRCPGCLGEPGEGEVCPRCGWREGARDDGPYLAPGSVLRERYWLGRVLGHGGFGVTYLGWDTVLELSVAIKEYLPADFASRAPATTGITVYPRRSDDFQYGLKRFLDEAKALGRFEDHPGIVSVRDYFEAHGTGYMVMRYVEGVTLQAYLSERGERLAVATALEVLMPVMDALRAMHEAGLIHRDISPDNIYLTTGGQVKLLDFGAARQATEERSRSLSVILKEGYAPEEQYRRHGPQGPWTDVYAVAATLYRLITGQRPLEALERLHTDELVPPSRLGIAIPEEIEAALLKGLAVRAGERYQDMGAFQRALSGEAPVSPSIIQDTHKATAPTNAKPKSLLKSQRWKEIIIAGLAVGLGLGGIGLWWQAPSPDSFVQDETAPSLSAQAGPAQDAPQSASSTPPTATAPPSEEPPASPSPGEVFRDRLADGGQGPELVVIPAGSFMMGSSESEAGRDDDERRHRVSIDQAFALGKHEVTFAEYDRFAAATGRDKPDDRGWGRGNRPVINVSWHDAVAYTEWLTEQTGHRYRLPTEAEWEYAARAGTETAYWWGNKASHEYANYGKDTCCGGLAIGRDRWEEMAPVGSFSPNPYGIYDTVGNVWEWTCSAYESDYDGSEGRCISKNDASAFQVYRGGSWFTTPRYVRAATRYGVTPDDRNFNLGFRLARPL